MFCAGFFLAFFFTLLKGIDGIPVYIFQHMRKGGEIVNYPMSNSLNVEQQITIFVTTHHLKS